MSSGFLTSYDTNRSGQLQKLARDVGRIGIILSK